MTQPAQVAKVASRPVSLSRSGGPFRYRIRPSVPFNPSPPLGRDIGEMSPKLPGQVSLPG